MLPSDAIGNFVNDTYIVPARARGDKTITIRASEVYWALNRRYELDLVCGVLGSAWFRNDRRVALERVDYPEASSKMATFRFRLDLSLVAA